MPGSKATRRAGFEHTRAGGAVRINLEIGREFFTRAFKLINAWHGVHVMTLFYAWHGPRVMNVRGVE